MAPYTTIAHIKRTGNPLRSEQGLTPAAGASLEELSSVQTVLRFLPELDAVGAKPRCAPVLGAWHRVLPQLDPQLLQPAAKLVQALDLLPLFRDVRLQLVAARPLGKELLRQLALSNLGPALNANLTPQARPEERGGDAWVDSQLLDLARPERASEDKLLAIDPLQRDDPG